MTPLDLLTLQAAISDCGRHCKYVVTFGGSSILISIYNAHERLVAEYWHDSHVQFRYFNSQVV
jgi:hypothetical protein